ncbi:hypothetical protein HAALTHF_43020n [Vreelandella aquamarina]|nr:hypothetical protein HAALTHF_43020n [Halomonas axialensis]
MTRATSPTPLRRTKIVATLGPASDRPGVLEAMLKAGVDVVRLNFSHGSADDHRRRLTEVREIAQRLGRSVAALGDLQGPKIRISRFKEGAIHLDIGQVFVLDMAMDANSGTAERVGCDYKALIDDVAPATVCCWTMVASCWTSRLSLGKKFTPEFTWVANCPTIKASTSKAAAFPPQR